MGLTVITQFTLADGVNSLVKPQGMSLPNTFIIICTYVCNPIQNEIMGPWLKITFAWVYRISLTNIHCVTNAGLTNTIMTYL